MWVYSNADEVELFINGETQGRLPSPIYGHVQWPAVPFTSAGSLRAVAYVNGTQAAEQVVSTVGPPAALRISIKDNLWNGHMIAGCADAISVAVAIIDASGNVHPLADNLVTFAITQGDAVLAGGSNGDPASLVNNKSPVRPAYHGLLVGIVLGGVTPGTVTVTASSPGFATVSIDIPQDVAPVGWATKWCHVDAQI